MATTSYQNKKSLSTPLGVDNCFSPSKRAGSNPLDVDNYLTGSIPFICGKLAYKKPNKALLIEYLTKYSELVTPAALELLDYCVNKKFQKIIEYQISTGGKRLRPVLAIISCQLLGGTIEDVLYPAAGLEILHNYSLIIDDIIDKSSTRRNKPTCWTKYGKSVSQCIGINYVASAFQAANQSKHPKEISELFAKTMKTSVEGEILDLLFEQKPREDEPYLTKQGYQEITQEDYLEMIKKKTAVVVQSCCEVGGICAGAASKELKAIKEYGLNVGVVGQIKDDILDIFGKEEKFGKRIGHDIKTGKLGNIVIILALEELTGKKKEGLLAIMRKKDVSEKQIKEAIDLIKQTKSEQRAYQLGKKFVEKAKESLNSLPQNQWNQALNSFADFILEREK